MTYRFRTAVALLFALLLVAMQQGAQSHALEHVGDWLQRPHDQGLQMPNSDAPCATCAAFASGTGAAPSVAIALPDPATDTVAPQWPGTSAAVDRPSPYQSRAPPSIL